MKYVKTKDNIYEIINDYGSSCAVKSRGKRGKTAIDGFIIKYGLTFAPRADTIEELWDYAVAVLDTVEKPIIEYIGYGGYTSKKEDFNDLFENDFNEEIKNGTGKLYGAIWTDKGLIYVANMNKDGKLCLI